ncbi:hypothetical protein EV651_11586 [Kribbella sp. VKM Ac-2571]|uniref:hypothetical protein n=1 Tax=Kribbella sp. VKM Ac-2571 TaxID=2512222 RepID=UPI00105E7199|nr:hypothetical protein [Kribbella sp. VKM Ac-2571]TDO55122.1 hypothetical protein EV651_11586 [Kribbella sp. VKM Ac-2571]
MTTDSAAFRIEVLLSFQRALWDLVTPNLRAIAVRPTHPFIEARFIYETVDQEEHLLTSEVGSYVIADFVPPVDIRFDAVAVPPSQSRELLAGEEWVYRRREDEPE